MHNLTPIDYDDEWTLRTVISRKHLDRRARLTAILNYVLARYAEYREHRLELSGIAASSITGDVVADYMSLYDSRTDEGNDLRRRIFDIQPANARRHCQYCTMARPRTLDHYAPQARFPELSLFSLNLVPCCFDCNHIKLQAWTEPGHRAIINYYFDQFLSYPILSAVLRFYADASLSVEFHVTSHPNVTQQQAQVFASHLRLLGLFERYLEHASAQIAEIRGIIARRAVQLSAMRQLLAEDAEVIAEQFGPNHWRTAITKALANSERFFEESYGAE